MLRPFRARTLVTALALASVTILSPSFVSQAHADKGGHGPGNSGDLTFVDGDLVMRDFVDRITLLNGSKDFVRKVPGLLPLLQEIGSVDPQLALSLWGQLTACKIWTTETTLRVRPPNETGLTSVTADIQAAYRQDSDILISLPAFAKAPQEYLLLHEAAHGLVSGSGPFHHIKVRAFIDYLKSNRGRYTAAGLSEAAVNSDLRVERSYLANENSEWNEKTQRLRQALFEKKGTPELRCSLYAILEESPYSSYLGWRELSLLRAWDSDIDCKKLVPVPFEVAKADYPLLAKVAQGGGGIDPGIGFVYEMTRGKIDWFTEGWFKKMQLEQCRQYASDQKQGEIDRLETRLNAARDQWAALQTDLRSMESDESLFLKHAYLKLLFSEGTYFSPGSESWYVKAIRDLGRDRSDQESTAYRIDDARRIYSANRAYCDKYFKGQFESGVPTEVKR